MSKGNGSNKRVAAKVDGKVYKRVERPATLHGLETVAKKKEKDRTGSSRAENAEVLLERDKGGYI